MRRPARLLITAAVAALALPASASAATTWTVDQAHAPGCDGTHVCHTIGEAVAAAGPSDTIVVKASATPYSEDPIVITQTGLTITADTAGAVTVTSKSTTAGADVIAIGDGTAGHGDNTTLKGLVVSVQANGGHAVLVRATGVTLDTDFLARITNNTQDVPALEVDSTPTVGTNVVKNTFVVQAPQGTGAQAQPAVLGGRTSTLELDDDFIVSGAKQGPGVALVGNARVGTDDTKPIANTVTRSQVFALNPAMDALTITSPSDSTRAKALTVDSSILGGGKDSGGLTASSASGSLPAGSSAGDVTVNLIHATIGGATKAITVNAAANGALLGTGSAQGSVQVTADRSIVHGTSSVTGCSCVPPVTIPNTAKLTITNSDTAQTASGSGNVSITTSGNSNTPDSALFANVGAHNLHLRADAPVIDTAGQTLAGESTKDVDGEPRVVGPAADKGADEFLNKPPKAIVTASTNTPRQNHAVTLDGTRSIDPEATSGGGIVQYHWDFGDGTVADTTTPTTTHVYADVGARSVTLTVTDRQGATSPVSDPLALNVIDGIPPVVKIKRPKAKQVITLFTTKVVKTGGKSRVVRVRRRVSFTGTATDASGVSVVIASIQLVHRSSKASGSARKCVYFNGKTKYVTTLCKTPLFFVVSFKNGVWQFRFKKTVHPIAGTYQLQVGAADKAGNVSNPVAVQFRLK